MISFRFHLVSIVAVFLALGLGVLTGTTVLNRGIVAQLERQTDQLAETSDRLREQVRTLQSEGDVWSRSWDQVTEYLIGGRLEGVEALIVTQEGTAAIAIDRVRRGLEAGGAEVGAVLSVDDRMALASEADIQELEALVGSAGSDAVTVTTEVAEALGGRLAGGPGADDLLEQLLGTGFLVNRGPGLGAAALRQLGGREQVTVVVAGGIGAPVLDPGAFLVPMVRAMVERGARVAAAEPTQTDAPFVAVLRDEVRTAAAIVTQDNVDSKPGEVGLVLAIEDLLLQGHAGHYGVKQGADGLLPPLST